MINNHNTRILSISSILVYFFWHNIFHLAILGEGFIYLTEPYYSWLHKNNFYTLIQRYDAFPLLFFGLFGKQLGVNIYWYNLFIYLSLVVIFYSIYKIIYLLTQDNYSSLLASVIFISNISGLYEMIGLGYYQWFVQRIPNFIPMLASFYFLLIYKKSKRNYYYVISLAMFLLAMFMSHYSFFMTPLFGLFILVSDKKIKQNILILSPYVLMTALFLFNQQPLSARDTISLSSIAKFSLVETFSTKLVLLTIPGEIFRYLWGVKAMDYIRYVSVPIAIFYLLIVSYVYFKSNNFVRSVYVSIIFSLTFSVIFSLSIKDEFFITSYVSRYLFIPSLFFSFFWGINFYTIFHKKSYMKYLSIVVIFFWVIINYLILRNYMQDRDYIHEPVLKTYNFIRLNNQKFEPNSVIIVSKYMSGYGTGTLNNLYSNNGEIIYTDILMDQGGRKVFYFDYGLENLELKKL